MLAVLIENPYNVLHGGETPEPTGWGNLTIYRNDSHSHLKNYGRTPAPCGLQISLCWVYYMPVLPPRQVLFYRKFFNSFVDTPRY